MKENGLPNTLTIPLPLFWRWFYAITAFFLVALGQPAFVPVFGLIASCIGYALFWRVLLCFSNASHRFWLSFIWQFAVQLIQLSWFISHPYFYIYAVYLFLAALFGLQFGIIGLLINRRMVGRLWRIIAIASLWCVFEWSRFFMLSGFSFNLAGIALGGSEYSMQMASIWGILGLSFWVFLTNLLALKAWISRNLLNLTLWLTAASAPYIFGATHVYWHDQQMTAQGKNNTAFNAVLVQTAFPVEEAMAFHSQQELISYVTEEWRKILAIIQPHFGKPIDLIALPEFVVPFGTYANLYPFENVVNIFREVLGKESAKKLPSPTWPLGDLVQYDNGQQLMVNNAFWVQSIANVFDAGIIAGLEDAEDLPNQEREYYSAALFFKPEKKGNLIENAKVNQMEHFCERYEKRILVPMGEYIPFAFCRELAKQYGVFGSFTPGTQAKTMQCGKIKISPSICYEETFGNIIQESKGIGADMLVNLTSDVWYPNSRLPVQHLEHARFRTVENGLPLLRACNTGVTAAIDSLGRSVGVLGGDSPEKAEWVSDALYVQVPTYTYQTLYSKFGDKLIISFSLLVIAITIFFRKFSI